MATIRSPRHTALLHASHSTAPSFSVPAAAAATARSRRARAGSARRSRRLLSPPPHILEGERERQKRHFLSWHSRAREDQRAGILGCDKPSERAGFPDQSRPPPSLLSPIAIGGRTAGTRGISQSSSPPRLPSREEELPKEGGKEKGGLTGFIRLRSRGMCVCQHVFSSSSSPLSFCSSPEQDLFM